MLQARIAVVLDAQGKRADAETEFQQVLDAKLRILGPDHPSTLTTRGWLESFSANDLRFR